MKYDLPDRYIWHLATQTGLTYLTYAFYASSICINTKDFSTQPGAVFAQTGGPSQTLPNGNCDALPEIYFLLK